MAIYISRKKSSGGGVTPTIITPSNSSPVSMTAGETYTPTTNGKAVGSITDVTPSNSLPATLSANTIYKPTTSGKAVASVTDLSSSWLQTLNANTVYKNGSSAQYAINSYSSSSKSPSSSGTYFSSGWNYMNSSGYAYSSPSASALCKTGSFSWSSSGQTTVNVGFKPKYLCIRGQSGTPTMIIYDEDSASGTTKFLHANGTQTAVTRDLGKTSSQFLYSINSDGFTLNKTGSGVTGYYFAIG